MITLNASFTWHCRPTESALDLKANHLRLRTDSQTDFWRCTGCGLDRDNGHFLSIPVARDFDMTTRVRFHPAHQYDQAGLMVRVGPRDWIKTSIEFEMGDMSRLGAVITQSGCSDWSMQDVSPDIHEYWLSIRRQGDVYTVHVSYDGRAWTRLRKAHLPGFQNVRCGVYACSPNEGDVVAEFDEFTLV